MSRRRTGAKSGKGFASRVLTKPRHDLFFEQIEGRDHLFMQEIADMKHATEVVGLIRQNSRSESGQRSGEMQAVDT